MKDDIHKTFTDKGLVEEDYDGLDSDRDTEAEVETAIRCCLENLTRRDERFGLYPIRCLTIVMKILTSDDYDPGFPNNHASLFVT